MTHTYSDAHSDARPHGARLRRLVAATSATAALVAGLLSGATAPAGAAAPAAGPAIPSWLVPIRAEREGTGLVKGCTAVLLGPLRAATAADCFTGRGVQDFLTTYNPDGGGGGTNRPRYRLPVRYDAATGRADFAVAHAGREQVQRPVLASASDNALYTAGARATFLSWTAATPTEIRTPHSEQVVVRSAADCAVLLGRPLPAGSLCTAPAPGAPLVPGTERCVGDAGGALVAAGKVIGLSATRATGCAASTVRLYTSVRAYRPQLVEWSRDMEPNASFDRTGSVVAREREPQAYLDFCAATPQLTRGCTAGDHTADAADFGLTYPLLTAMGDADGDGTGDLLARRTNGDLYRFDRPTISDLDSDPKVLLGRNFGIYNTLLAVRDLSGDGIGDLLGRDSAGVLWLHHGTADGKLSVRTRVGSGYQQYSALAGRGDYDGDGRSDLVARDRNGVLWLHAGNGAGGLRARVKVGTGWNAYNSIVGSGDMDADGRQDLVVRTPAGAAYVYNSDGKGHFAPKRWATTQWKQYLRIG
ncbi:FG-GAP-like repeat-containing protein [Streptomyces sp. NRRL S-87]|uniref:FG-GAP-like repeat-containing protein n=1 Tax=Streptomyces sp. NRRL S-87 TaxID=1463920 RepID=UPI00131DFA5F|nr:FG-GAP-like repeat-containing protein [Streptomyces sp. NRRL S-87]